MFSTTASFFVPPGTILQLINEDTKLIRQVVVMDSADHMLPIASLPICTTLQICGAPSYKPHKELGFGIMHSSVLLYIEGDLILNTEQILKF